MHTIDNNFLCYEISDNISETPEGFLICHNVPMARIGTQKYLGQEIGVNDKFDQEILVYRLPEDIFHKDTLASFEGKLITDDHPTQPVGPDNQSAYNKGHVQNVHRVADYIVGDMVIVDATLISKIKNKVKRQVSAGYDCRYDKYKDGYKQSEIIVNHVAIVDKGRAGDKVAVKDSKVGVKRMNKKKLQELMFAAYVKDASPEEILEAARIMTADSEPENRHNESTGLLAKLMQKFVKDSEEEKPEENKPEEKKEEAKPVTVDERMDALEKGFNEMKDSFAKFTNKDADEEEDIKLIEELLANEEEEAAASDEEPEELKKEDYDKTKDAKKQFWKDMAPVLAGLPENQRKKVKDALVKNLRGKSYVYAGIQKAIQSHHSQDKKQTKDTTYIGQDIAKAYNPHYKNRPTIVNIK